MKTPAQILNKHTPPGKGYHSSWIIPAMKEYAKQWIDEAVEIAFDPTKFNAHRRIADLKKEIDSHQ